eukprot:366090-Chlamydomonas_euryale.AAC.6
MAAVAYARRSRPPRRDSQRRSRGGWQPRAQLRLFYRYSEGRVKVARRCRSEVKALQGFYMGRVGRGSARPRQGRPPGRRARVARRGKGCVGCGTARAATPVQTLRLLQEVRFAQRPPCQPSCWQARRLGCDRGRVTGHLARRTTRLAVSGAFLQPRLTPRPYTACWFSMTRFGNVAAYRHTSTQFASRR